MSVSREVSRAHVEHELAEARSWIERQQWSVFWEPNALRLTVRMGSRIDDEKYVFEFSLDDYRELPPAIELVHPLTGERGTRRCYPAGGNGYFHSKPVICAPWNRNAYSTRGGPHGDWDMKNWATYRPNHRRLGSILALLQLLLDSPNAYQGRMAQ